MDSPSDDSVWLTLELPSILLVDPNNTDGAISGKSEGTRRSHNAVPMWKPMHPQHGPTVQAIILNITGSSYEFASL